MSQDMVALTSLQFDGKLFYDPELVDPDDLREVTKTLDEHSFFFARARVDKVDDPELRTRSGDWLVGAAAIKAYFDSE